MNWRSLPATNLHPPERLPMLRALFVAIVALVGMGPVLAAADIDTCRDPAAESEARLVACSAVTADDTITGKPRAAAYQVIGDAFMKKRDYDGAIDAFGKAHEADPDQPCQRLSDGLGCGARQSVIPGWCVSTRPGISRFR